MIADDFTDIAARLRAISPGLMLDVVREPQEGIAVDTAKGPDKTVVTTLSWNNFPPPKIVMFDPDLWQRFLKAVKVVAKPAVPG